MSTQFINDSRSFVWTVSQEIKDTYCIYLSGKLFADNLSLDSFITLYNQIRG